MPADRKNDTDDLFDWGTPGGPEAGPEPDTYGVAAPEPLPEAPASVLPDMGPADENRPTQVRRRKKRKKDRAEDDGVLDDGAQRPEYEPVPIPSLISSLWYPLTNSGWWAIPILALLLGEAQGLLGLGQLLPIPLLAIVTLLATVIMAMVTLLFLETANYTLEAIPNGPRFPLLGWDSLPAGMYGLTTMMVALIPLIIGSAVLGWFGVSGAVPQLLLTACAMSYVPMGFLALANLENEHALNPLVVVRGMRRMRGRYFVLVAIATVAFIVPAFGLMLLNWPPFVEYPLRTMVLLYTTTALMRAVAILFRKQPVSFERSSAPE